MSHHDSPHCDGNQHRLTELMLLYQFSNTMLSTIRLNKLTHLILTAITTPSSRLFERAILFLRNEKSNVLQGMLGVTRNLSDNLQIVGSNDALDSRWDISDEAMLRQRSSNFCVQVRLTRIDIDNGCQLIHQIVTDRTLCRSDNTSCHHCTSCTFIKPICNGLFAAVPLVARDTTIGMIVVDNPETCRDISSSDLHFLQLFANQAGMAIENSMLYNRIENAHQNLSDIRERLIHGEHLATIGEMAANLAHELKNPLITIGGFAGRLLKSLPSASRERQYAQTIASEATRLEAMLTEILAFSRKPTICFNECNLREILLECISVCATSIEDRGVTVSFTGDEVPCNVSGDSNQLRQVFLNLILNACDAMTEGGTLTVAMKKVFHDHKKIVMVTVEDTGGGIPAEMLPQIFNPFFTTKHHGTGLGLAIVNRIICNHFGTVEAHNGQCGAVFTIQLPLACYEE